MKIQRDPDAATFLKAAGPLLYAREAEYGLILGMAESLAAAPCPTKLPDFTPVLLRLEVAGETRAALVQTRAENSIVSDMSPSQAEAFADYLLAHKGTIVSRGAVGPRQICRELVQQLARRLETDMHLSMGQRILAAENVIEPLWAPGAPSIATPEDLDIIFDFLKKFCDECLLVDPFDPRKVRLNLEAKIAKGYVHLWKVRDEAVATAHLGRPTRHGISIGAVYTPPVHRGRGYASNLMAHLTRTMLAQGRRFCALYTDITNPTSNKIYESVGYRLVGESEFYRLDFTRAPR